MTEDNSIVNGLWIGRSLSKLELLTIHSFLALGHQFRLWLYDELDTPLPQDVIIGDATMIIPRDKVFAYKGVNKYGHGKGSYAGFSDIFRYKLLYDYGGWWVDMDVTALRPLDFDEPYFFRDHHELMVVGNVMKSPRHSPLMKACYEEASDQVDENNTDWHKPIDILNQNISQLQLKKYIRKGVSNPDQWDVTKNYISRSEVPPQDWYFIHWQNEEWRSKNIDRNEFYYRSALASLMWLHGLSTQPANAYRKIVNHIRYSDAFRILQK